MIIECLNCNTKNKMTKNFVLTLYIINIVAMVLLIILSEIDMELNYTVVEKAKVTQVNNQNTELKETILIRQFQNFKDTTIVNHEDETNYQLNEKYTHTLSVADHLIGKLKRFNETAALIIIATVFCILPILLLINLLNY